MNIVQSQEVQIGAAAAFLSLQEYHGAEMGRLAGDIAAKNAYIGMLQRELQAAQERIAAMEQNLVETEVPRNGAMPSGANLREVEMSPKAPSSLRKVRDNPQA